MTVNLQAAVDMAVRWPTPRAEDSESTGAHRGEPDTLTSAVRWSTPTTRDAESPAKVTRGAAGLKLSPDWAEWLMGWPVMWSSLEPLTDATARGWNVDPGDTGEVPRTTGGCANRRARLRAIGNGQVPQCAATAFRLLAETLLAPKDVPL